MLVYPGGGMICPLTGKRIPKTLKGNIEARTELIRLAQDDKRVQLVLMDACEKSFAFWVNLFGWTYRINETDEHGITRPVHPDRVHVPFITWPVQDDVAAEIINSIEQGEDRCLDKSRDMGATWLLVAIFHWYWLFKKDVPLLWISRKEDLVDKPGSPDAIFWKHDYMTKRLPSWMRPTVERRAMHMTNKRTGSVIEGESTNADAGRGGRRRAIAIDEAAAIDNLEEVMRATDQATACRLFNSTPKGPGAYSDIRFSGRVKVSVLPWYRHPEKGIGAHQVTDAKGKTYWTGPWRESQVAKKTPREVAQNIDMDHAAAGAMFFDSSVLNRQKATWARLPTHYGHVQHTGEVLRVSVANKLFQNFSWAPSDPLDTRPCLHLWCGLVHGRPDQTHAYAIGGDVSQGVGGSFSALSIFDKQTGHKVGEYLDSMISPDDLATLAASLGMWFGGASSVALICVERNGPGQRFHDTLERLGYPNIYRHIPSGKSSDQASNTLGWQSNRDEKEAKLGQYANALARDDFRNPSGYSLDQCGRYVYLKSGAVGPGELESVDGSARAVHGDVVIADALAYEGSLRLRRTEAEAPRPMRGSRKWYEEQEKAQKTGDDEY